MSHRMPQVNELLRAELSELISREGIFPNGLITIIYVKSSPNLRAATVGISVLPENVSGSALVELRRHSSAFSSRLRKKLNLKQIPRFNWKIDIVERRAAEIDKLLQSC